MRRFVAIALSSSLALQTAPLVAAGDVRPRQSGVQAPVTTGVIKGTAKNAAGEALPNYTVQLRNLQTGQLAATTTSDGLGGFSFLDLDPANYIVEIANANGAILATSAPLTVAAGSTLTVTVSAATATLLAAGGGVSTALVITTIAAAAGIAGVVVAVKKNASPSQ